MVNAVWALGELGTKEIILSLHSLALCHCDGKVCEACFQAIDKLTLIFSLPRPEISPELDISTLPRPATSHKIDTSDLPAFPVHEVRQEGNEGNIGFHHERRF